jgi:hypothetical protein
MKALILAISLFVPVSFLCRRFGAAHQSHRGQQRH